MLVSKRMTRDPVSASPDLPLAEALRVLRGHRVRHLPVVAGGEVVGIVTDRDLRLALPSPLSAGGADAEAVERTPVSRLMTRGVVTIGPYDSVEDAAKLMHRHRIGGLPVVDAHGALLGMLSETDVLDAFAEMLGPPGASSRLELALPDRPGELARAMGIIGAELGLNICSLMVPPGRHGERRIAIVHLATIDPREMIAALEAAGYQVGWPSLEMDLRRGAPA
ncbi:MAG TPA: CBS and ACT domain-containing protein [Longimicrobium sp.]|nr:CBS and ACT domain-containing protein [Longimicrobium sp.]